MEYEYTCGLCKKVFTSTRPDGEAMQEVLDIFGVDVVSQDELVRVCHTCYIRIDPKGHPEEVQATKDHFKKNPPKQA